jgi:hypothetical protein
LRSFSATNAGCIPEPRHLILHVPLDRRVLIVAETTDAAFLQHTLRTAWEELTPESPNRRRSLDEAAVHRFEPDSMALRRLMSQLCDAGAR